MKQKFIIKKGSKSLALFFTGWASDYNILSDAECSCDVLVAYDYTNFDFDTTEIADYHNINIFAWSFGIVGANAFINNNPKLNISLKVAINGTQTPYSDELGIPTHIYDGTHDNLNERNLKGFYRHLCDSRELCNELTARCAEVCDDIESLKKQLISVKNYSSNVNYQTTFWDIVILSQKDRIFPIENCLNAWRDNCDQIKIEEFSHYTKSLSKIISSYIIDKELVKKNFSASFNSTNYDKTGIIQREITQNLITLMTKKTALSIGKSVLEVGCGTGFLTNQYLNLLYPSKLILNDLCEIPSVLVNLLTTDYNFIQGDAESLNFDQNTFDYILSTSAIQWFENLPQFLDNATCWLKNNGYLILSTFGQNNMNEVSFFTKRALSYKSVEWFRNTLSANYDILYLQEETNILEFDSPSQVFKHLQLTGVNSISNKTKSVSDMRNMLKNYPCINGKYQLTYNPIYIIAKKKSHE